MRELPLAGSHVNPPISSQSYTLACLSVTDYILLSLLSKQRLGQLPLLLHNSSCLVPETTSTASCLVAPVQERTPQGFQRRFALAPVTPHLQNHRD